MKGATMPFGPVELMVVKFPGSQFRGEIVPALADLVDRGYIRIIDLLFATVDEEGITVTELSELDSAEIEIFDSLISEVSGLIAAEDIEYLAESLEVGDSAAMLLYEMPWAKTFGESLRNANAELINRLHIPAEVVDLVAGAAAELHAEAVAELEASNGQLSA
jgi:hypothetical protein